MEITTLKQQLDMIEVASRLGIVVNKQGKAHCPFHEDKTPSLQFSKEKQIATCFSANCTTGTMDVISLTEKKLNLSTHQAIEYLKSMLSNSEIPQGGKALKYLSGLTGEVQQPKPPQIKNSPNYQKDFEQMQGSFIASSTARNYLASRSIAWNKLNAGSGSPVGYNAFKNSKFSYLRGCVTFGLKSENGKVVSMYGRSVRDNDKGLAKDGTGRHYYTANRKGLYPAYPDKATKTLILTESVIDAATLLSIKEIAAHYEILALYGTNGLTTEHTGAVSQLEALEEVILFFDGDAAGQAATAKHGKYLQELLPNVKLSVVETVEGEDINSLAQGHDVKIFTQLLKEKKPFSFSSETKEQPVVAETPLARTPAVTETALNTFNPNKITYTTETAAYYIKGGIRKDLDSLKVTLVIEHPGARQKSRNKLDLYEDKQTEKISRESAEKLGLRADLIENDLNVLTDLLDEYREETADQTEQEAKQIIIPLAEKVQCRAFLKAPDLLQRINDLIGKSGVVGEENNRIFLFGIASSYKMQETLHALIQGSSGSGKTHLLATIMDFMPPEDTLSLTRVTESSFYNYGKYELQNKLIGMEDYDGLEEKAELAFRELQSKGMITSSTSGKNEHTGEISGYIKTVYGPIASLSATTKGEIYEDNMSRCFLVAVDESSEQTQRIIRYQNNRAAGLIDKAQEKGTGTFLRNCMRLLKPYEVVNPYANKINLPKEAHKIRRLNDLFQSYVKQVTILNQYQRKTDQQGRLITDKEDVKTAIEIMFDSILLKVDELDGSLRDFYERLKSYVNDKGRGYAFTRLEIRQSLKVSKTQQHSYLNQLLTLEYIWQVGGYANRGFKYKIAYWDNNEKLRNDIRTYLNNQIDKL